MQLSIGELLARDSIKATNLANTRPAQRRIVPDRSTTHCCRAPRSRAGRTSANESFLWFDTVSLRNVSTNTFSNHFICFSFDFNRDRS